MNRITPRSIAAGALLLTLSGCGGGGGTHSTPPPPPASPILSTPADGETLQPVILVLGWQSVSGAVSYEVEVAVSQSFAVLTESHQGWTGTTKKVGPMAPGTQYFWHVRCSDGKSSSDWSNPRTFTTAGMWEFRSSGLPALALYSDGTTVAAGDSFDVKVVSYNLQDVFGAALRIIYPHDVIGVGRILYNPTLFGDQTSCLVMPPVRSDLDRVDIGFTYVRGSGRSIRESSVLALLRCRALKQGAANVGFAPDTLVVRKSDGTLFDYGSLTKIPLSLTVNGAE